MLPIPPAPAHSPVCHRLVRRRRKFAQECTNRLPRSQWLYCFQIFVTRLSSAGGDVAYVCGLLVNKIILHCQHFFKYVLTYLCLLWYLQFKGAETGHADTQQQSFRWKAQHFRWRKWLGAVESCRQWTMFLSANYKAWNSTASFWGAQWFFSSVKQFRTVRSWDCRQTASFLHQRRPSRAYYQWN